MLTVPDCPNAPMVRERIALALDGRTVPVDMVEVSDQDQAARWGMTGSPTVLVDGVDPFAVPGAVAGVACRLYRDADGRVSGAPDVADLRRALDAAGLPDGAGILDPVGRGGRGRLAPVERGLRAVQQEILRRFAAAGSAPGAGELEAVARRFGRSATQVLAELAQQDFVTLDDDGAVRAAYPFSAVPTAHRVTIAGGTQVWSMCAVDALGIPVMLGCDAVITSTDPVSGEPVTVTATGGAGVADGMAWQPADAVVFVGRRCCDGPAAEVCCGALNFFTSPATAELWAAKHPDVVGQILTQADAEQLGARIFGHLLDSDCCADQ